MRTAVPELLQWPTSRDPGCRAEPGGASHDRCSKVAKNLSVICAGKRERETIHVLRQSSLVLGSYKHRTYIACLKLRQRRIKGRILLLQERQHLCPPSLIPRRGGKLRIAGRVRHSIPRCLDECRERFGKAFDKRLQFCRRNVGCHELPFAAHGVGVAAPGVTVPGGT